MLTPKAQEQIRQLKDEIAYNKRKEEEYRQRYYNEKDSSMRELFGAAVPSDIKSIFKRVGNCRECGKEDAIDLLTGLCSSCLKESKKKKNWEPKWSGILEQRNQRKKRIAQAKREGYSESDILQEFGEYF